MQVTAIPQRHIGGYFDPERELGQPDVKEDSSARVRDIQGAAGRLACCRQSGQPGGLVALDFDPAVTAVASQPFWLLWQAGGKVRRHAPDFFARLAGAGALVDSRSLERIGERDREAFAAPGAACARLGWRESPG